jgi:hypothetical protein
MKKLILVFAVVAITAGAYAQADSTDRKMSPSDINNTDDGLNQNQDLNNTHNQKVQNNPVDKLHPDGVMMQNGKMMTVKNGQMTILDRDITMSNGTKVMSDGTYIKKEGTKSVLKEGQHMDMSGNLIPMKTTKEKNLSQDPDSTMNQGF